MQVGIIGLPNAGKSTIFNTLTKGRAEVASYPFCTIEPNIGITEVPDNNIQSLSDIYNSAKITPATIRILDIAGLVKGASRGEGLGNKFLSHIRTVDVIAHIVRCFYDENVSHIDKDIDPAGDIGIINTELLLADIEILQRKREKLISISKSGDALAKSQLGVVEFITGEFNNERIPDLSDLYGRHNELFDELNLLSIKPTLYIANTGDGEKDEELYKKLITEVSCKDIIKIFAKLESELLELPKEERSEYARELGVDKSGLSIFIKTCYEMLDLITFYTINKNETRAWSIKKGSNVLKAAGKIHSDMEKGFIKAEVINARQLLDFGSVSHAREEGKVRIEGKDYIVGDKDVIQVRFSV
jgi:GTP-binding protein YchF